MNESIMKSHLQHEEIRKSIGCFVFKMIDNGFNYFCNLGNNGIDVPVVSDKVITKQFFQRKKKMEHFIRIFFINLTLIIVVHLNFYKSNNHVIAIKILTTLFFPFLSLLIYVLHYLVLLKTQNTAITYLNSFLLEIPVLVNRVCSFDLRTIRTPNHTFQLLVLIS